MRKRENFSLYSLQPQFLPQILALNLPNLEIFSSQDPLSEAMTKPHTSEIRAANPYLK